MPGLDYSRFDKLGASDSEDEASGQGRAAEAEAAGREAVAQLPPELSPELSLVLASRHGQRHVVEALLDNRASVNAADPHGGTALLRAVEGGINNRPVIELLVARRACVDLRSDTNETPLGHAASRGPAELCQALFEAAAPEPKACGAALAAAAVAGNRATTAFFLGLRAPACISYEGRLPMNAWAGHGSIDVMEQLLQRRADINACDEQGVPLMCAVHAGCVSVVAWLCNNGAIVDWAAPDGRTALICAVEHSNEACAASMVDVLLEKRAAVEPASTGARVPSPLVAAACAGRVAIGRLLLDAGAAPGTADPAGRRPLPCAAVLGSFDFCTLLLEKRAGVSDRGMSGSHPAAGADPAVGVTALSVAVAAGDMRLATMLLEAHADCELADQRDFRPLMAAARGGHVALCILLMDARAEVNAQQVGSGKTALVFAAGVGSLEVCATLLAARADMEVQAVTGVRALHAATANGHEAVCKALLAAGADAAAAGPHEQDALALARAAGHVAVSAVLAAARAPTTAAAVPASA